MFLFTGFFRSDSILFGSHTLHNSFPGYTSVLITKYDSAGNNIWAKSSNGFGRPFCLAIDSHDHIYTTGTILNNLPISFDTITMTNPGNDAMYAVEHDSSGNVMWGQGFNFGGDDQNSVTVGPSDNVYFGGDYLVAPAIFGNDTLGYSGAETIFLAKLRTQSYEVGINDVNSDKKFSLFPNPFNSILNIIVNETESSEIILYDILSIKLLQQTFSSSTIINTEKLANGIYIYEVRNQNRIIKRGKVIKQ